ncbi:ABC transporter permease subunit [Granulicella sibirica]|uniref:Peptide ABC transporter, permease protein n=1 Tax=Granulicella sibirica TaxID=2479048 RepID=A0A4V1L5Y1_9BACT|nr:ABC transporter permease subunit [Granulicella sibirica]RXH57344.1 peptide ABC transporter, permease protein [Granulicella sibirica]
MTLAFAIVRRLSRVFLLMLLAAMGTIVLMRFSPGYYTDIRELDPKYAQSANTAIETEENQHGSLAAIARNVFAGWLHGDLGRSRQYDAPVSELVRPRIGVTLSLLARSIVNGWLIAFAAALPISTLRRGATLVSAPFTLLLAIPTGAMATVSLLADTGGPVLVLSLILAARDFKFLARLFRVAWRAPHLLQVRAQGMRFHRVIRTFILPNVAPQVFALATLSLVTALSAVVPVEVIFDAPGLGQLAWSAAMNRDLPVLLTVTLLMAFAVACAGMVSERMRPLETA